MTSNAKLINAILSDDKKAFTEQFTKVIQNKSNQVLDIKKIAITSEFLDKNK